MVGDKSRKRFVVVQKPTWSGAKKPTRPVWRNGQRWSNVWSFVEWPLQWLDYLLSCTSLGRVAEHVAKLSVLVVVIFFLWGKADEIWNSKRTRQLKLREDVRNNVETLLPDSNAVTMTRQWALISLKKHFDTSISQGVRNGTEHEQFLFDANRLQFSGLDLSELDLSGTRFLASQFRGANLRGTDLQGADFKKCNLTDAQLAGASLAGADLTSATLKGAILSNIEAAPGGGFIFVAAKLDKRTRMVSTSLDGAMLRGLRLDEVDLSNSDLRNSTLVGRAAAGTYPSCRAASLRNANLRGAKLQGLDFTGVDLTGAILDKAELDGANLSQAIGLTKLQYATANVTASTKLPNP